MSWLEHSTTPALCNSSASIENLAWCYSEQDVVVTTDPEQIVLLELRNQGLKLKRSNKIKNKIKHRKWLVISTSKPGQINMWAEVKRNARWKLNKFKGCCIILILQTYYSNKRLRALIIKRKKKRADQQKINI